MPKSPPTQNHSKSILQPKAHPFSADSDTLSLAFPHLSVPKEKWTKSLVWLPSSEETPLPSDNVLGQVDLDPSSLKIKPWAVWSFEFSPENFLECEGSS